MKRTILLFAVCFAISTAVMAQGPVLRFMTTHHDFGGVKEDDGPVTYRYKFINNGTTKLKLTNVQPACGCTVAHWTRDSVAPYDSGYVDATFDVNHRPGAFSKSVTVYSNQTPSVSLLTFSGTVIPHQRTMIDSFPFEIGNLRFEQNHLDFGHITNNITDTFQYLSMFNTSNSPVVIKELNNRGSAYIFAKDLPFTVPAHSRAKLAIHYNANQYHDFGLDYKEVTIITTDEKVSDKKVSLLADVHPYVARMTDEEKTKGPRIFFPDNRHDFGDVKQGDVVTTNFAFTNKGKKELVIFKLKPSCGCTTSDPEKSKLKPGETSNIKVSFNSAGMHGTEEKQIVVYSNDPLNPEYTLKITSKVSLNGGIKETPKKSN